MVPRFSFHFASFKTRDSHLGQRTLTRISFFLGHFWSVFLHSRCMSHEAFGRLNRDHDGWIQIGYDKFMILDLYQRAFEDLLAIPVIPCVKSEKEKFVGSLYTTTVEGFIPTSGRGIQGTTSPRTELFAEDPNDPSGGKTFVWQNSWGMATRTIGVKVMVHGDNKGLVLLPPMASVQVVIVWHAELCGITAKMTDKGRAVINNACEEPAKTLKKFNDWKRKTVPRDTGLKHPIALGPTIVALLTTIQSEIMGRHRPRAPRLECGRESMPTHLE
ncbi:hypothetical protein B0H14DRAFT_3873390 [Mycena olivaceomarginata]|nr:hypothetical protein B0H14DRAFT_3873390 [Mycena olivaceomarginata]